MTLAPPPGPSTPQLEPLALPWDLRLSPEQFELVCRANPDASLLRLDRWTGLTPEQRRGFAPLCPDLVVELASASDDGPRGLSALRRKMENYRANGAQLRWLLIPEQQAVEIWTAGAVVPQRLAPTQVLDAGALFPVLRIELAEIWAG